MLIIKQTNNWITTFFFFLVKGARLQEIVLGPVSEPIQQGGSVTLNCTVHTGSCDGDHSVYWFRHGQHQGILHTHRGQCDRSTPGPSPSQSCVYYLLKNNLSSSDAGTYNCAVVSCGEILFGKGTKLLIADDVEGDILDQMAQMNIFVWLSIIRTGIVLFFLVVCTLIYMFRSWSSNLKIPWIHIVLTFSSECSERGQREFLLAVICFAISSNFEPVIYLSLTNSAQHISGIQCWMFNLRHRIQTLYELLQPWNRVNKPNVYLWFWLQRLMCNISQTVFHLSIGPWRQKSSSFRSSNLKWNQTVWTHD